MKQKNLFRILIVVATVVISLVSLVPTFRTFGMTADERMAWQNEHPAIADKAMKLGLDLQGGTHIILEVKTEELDAAHAKDATDRALEVIRNRIDQFGVSEPDIRRIGDDRILVELAGVTPERASGLISSTAQLQFKLVREAADVRLALDRVEATVNRARGKGGADTAAAAKATPSDTAKLAADTTAKDTATLALDSAKAAQDSASLAARKLFAGDIDTATAAADTGAKTAENYMAKAFYSYLLPVGNDIGVDERNVPTVKKILARTDVQNALRSVETDLLWGRKPTELRDGRKVRILFVLKRKAEMKGDYIADAQPEFVQGDIQGGAGVLLKLKDRGPKEFSRITGMNIGRQLAIVLDDAVYSAPVIKGKISQGTASITGLDDINEARDLAIILRAGALPAPMQIIEERSVGPALGAENISQGVIASLIGTALVFAFMFYFYHAAGAVANAALVINILALLALLAGVRATLTLPGIAGIVLTVGMAVDANVLIYERMREEIRAGRSIRAAIDAGYKRAFSAIFDSNVTTVLTAFVLYKLGTGPIRGFGLTLTLGIIVSMFTALYCTRVAFDVWLAARERTRLAIGHSILFFEKAKLDILGKAKVIGIVSGVLGLLILVSLVIPKGKDSHFGLNYGIDFTGGVLMTANYDGPLDANAMTAKLEKAGLEGVVVKTLGAPEDKSYSIAFKTQNMESDKAQDLSAGARQVIERELGGANGKLVIEGAEVVGPKIGNELKRNAVLAGLLSLLIIVFYVWVRFGRNGLGYGIASVVTLIHDTLLTLGLFSILDLEVDMTVVAAILTLIGYSLNDTIVIFDRIRENAGKYRKDDFPALVNNSINETLSRTLMTSIATILVAIVLWIWGGPTLRNFSICLTFGILIGTYSSIAISAPLVVMWVKWRGNAGVEPGKKLPRPEARVGQA